MDDNHKYYTLQSIKLSFLSRKAQLIRSLEDHVDIGTITILDDQIKWCNTMIKSLDTMMEDALSTEIPF